MHELHRFRALTFDVYGTLIDWESGLLGVLEPWARTHGLAPRGDALLEIYARQETALQAAEPAMLYPAVVAGTLDRIAQELSAPRSTEWNERLAASIGTWPPFVDTTPALQRLRSRYVLGVLSNVDRTSFAHTAQLLGVPFDVVLTAEDIGSYKPDRRNFERAIETLAARGIAKHEILHVAQSLMHDHVPARALGLTTAWIDRRHAKQGFGATAPPPTAVDPNYRFASLAAFADAAA